MEKSTEDEEIWVGRGTDSTLGAVQPRGVVLAQVHPRSVCAGYYCVIHNPSNHHMRQWPTLWRADRRLMERTCPHGVGHPDPDDLSYHIRNGRRWQGVHGCDGCCDPTRVGEE